MVIILFDDTANGEYKVFIVDTVGRVQFNAAHDDNSANLTIKKQETIVTQESE
jgi:hypothetical protein